MGPRLRHLIETNSVPAPPSYFLISWGISLLLLSLSQLTLGPEPVLVLIPQLAVPAVFACSIASFGVYSYYRLPTQQERLTAIYALVVATLAGGVYLVIVLVIMVDGGQPYDPSFVGLTTLSFGSLVGVVIGLLIYDLNESKTELQTNLERTRFLNQHLKVVNRILRHNVRNRLTVASGYLAEEQEERNGQSTNLRHAICAINELLECTEKTLAFHRVGPFDQIELVERDLTADVEQVIEAFGSLPQTSEISEDLPDRALVRVHPAIDIAIAEAVENAITHTNTAVSVTITVVPGDEFVHLRIADDGMGIPAGELDAIELDEETQLRHGSGVGLWLISWIVSLSNGELDIMENDPTGTVVWIRLPAVDAEKRSKDYRRK